MSKQTKKTSKCVASGLSALTLALAAMTSGHAATINVVPAWNLLGNSDSAAVTVASAFGNAANVLTVWKWVPSTAKWAFYTPSLADGGAAYAVTKGYDFLTTINPGEGYWVNAKVAHTATTPAGTALTGLFFQDVLTPPNPVPAGWSLISVGDNSTPLAFNNILSPTPPPTGTIVPNLTTLWAWDSAAANWYFYAPSLDATAGALAAYITSKSYLNFATTARTLAPSTGFWVNRPASAGLPGTPVVTPVNPAQAGIQTTMAAFQGLFAAAIPAASSPALAALFDATLLNGGLNKAAFLAQLVTPGNGPGVGAVMGNVTLVTPLDSTAVPNDATHQWYTFSVTPGGGPTSPWLAIKDSVSGNWLAAGDQRQFNTNTVAQAVQIVPSALQKAAGALPSYQNQVSFGVSGNNTPVPASITQITLTGPGLTPLAPSTEVPIYTPTTGQIWIGNCPPAGAVLTAGCMNVAQVTTGSQYVYHVYTGGATQAYSYTDVLARGPVSAASLVAANFPVITATTGNFASGSTVTANWTLPAGASASWFNTGAWTSVGVQLFNTGAGLVPTSTSGSLVLPTYNGAVGSQAMWLQVNDASGNQFATNLQLDPGQVITAPVTPVAPVVPVNAAALTGITGTMNAFQTLFATALPLATDPALVALFDPTMLANGKNLTTWLAGNTAAVGGLPLGTQFTNIALATPFDSGAAANDATHQWFTFDVPKGGGGTNKWLAIQNAAGNWVIAGNQRQFGFNSDIQNVQFIPSATLQPGAVTSYFSQIGFGTNNKVAAAGVAQILVTGPGLVPLTGVLMYSSTLGNINIPSCSSTVVTNCMDMTQALVNSAYTAHVYTTVGGLTTPAYTYTNHLTHAAMPLASLTPALFPVVNSMTGTGLPGSTLTINYALPTGVTSANLTAYAWDNLGQTLVNSGGQTVGVGPSLVLTVPAYSGTIYGKGAWLQYSDAAGNIIAVSKDF